MVAEVVQDNTGANKSILKGVVGDSVVFIISPEAFTPSSSETNAVALIAAGFSTVSKGIQLSSAISSNKFQGIATDSDALGSAGGSTYLKSNTNSQSKFNYNINPFKTY